MNRISVLVLTRNEAQDLPGCLSSVKWSNDVWVLDSESTDDTVAIALAHGAKVKIRRFDGYATQRNFGLTQLPFEHEWLLILDADERVTPQLATELEEFIKSPPADIVAGRVTRHDFFMGRHLKHAQISPYYIRLVKPIAVRYEREVNELLVVEGKIQEFSGPLEHFPFSKGMSHWFDKHNTYSSMEASLILNAERPKAELKRALIDPDFNVRRFHQKAIFNGLPCKPIVKLFYMLLIRRSFLDGLPGLHYTLLQCVYEYMIAIKVQTSRKR